MSEAEFTKKVKKYLDKVPKCWYFKVWGGGLQKRGIPDIIGIVNGKFIALELKASDGKATELQKRSIRLIRKCGGYAKVVFPEDWPIVRSEIDKL